MVPGVCSATQAATRAARVGLELDVERRLPGLARVSKITVEMPRAWWNEFKMYRLDLWRAEKLWPRETGGGQMSGDTATTSGWGGVGESNGLPSAYDGMASTSYDASGPPPPCAIL